MALNDGVGMHRGANSAGMAGDDERIRICFFIDCGSHFAVIPRELNDAEFLNTKGVAIKTSDTN